jgi:hypothetical protein
VCWIPRHDERLGHREAACGRAGEGGIGEHGSRTITEPSRSWFPALRDELAALEDEIGRLKTPTCNPASSKRQGRNTAAENEARTMADDMNKLEKTIHDKKAPDIPRLLRRT